MLDSIKTAIFNVLGPGFTYRRVLDLFAGSGSLGFEAASRGASEVALVERDYRNVEYMRRNAARLGLEAACRIVRADAALFLKSSAAGYDLVFVDPPFEWADGERLAEVMALAWAAVDDGGVLVLRVPAACDQYFLPASARLDARRYGKSKVVFARRRAMEP